MNHQKASNRNDARPLLRPLAAKGGRQREQRLCSTGEGKTGRGHQWGLWAGERVGRRGGGGSKLRRATTNAPHVHGAHTCLRGDTRDVGRGVARALPEPNHDDPLPGEGPVPANEAGVRGAPAVGTEPQPGLGLVHARGDHEKVERLL